MNAGPRLAVVLGLLAVTAAVVHSTPSLRESSRPAALYDLPAAVSGWSSVDAIPDGILPIDLSETAGVRRTYQRGQRVAWVSVAMFTRQDQPERRASINRIYPEKDVSLLEAVPLSLLVNGSTVPVTAVIVSGSARRFVVVYWHQIGQRMYPSESRFRLALMREIVFARRGDSLLVRIAVPVGPGGVPASLTTTAELAPALFAALAGPGGF